MISEAEFTDYEREVLEQTRQAIKKAGDELLACPQWRIFKRATLRDRWVVECKVLAFLYDAFEQDARDRKLFNG